MSDSVTMTIEGTEDLAFTFERLAQEAPQLAMDAINKTCLNIESEAKKNCNVGLTGMVRDSIHANPAQLETMEGSVGVYSPAGEWLEFGTVPHMPPVQALLKWVEAKFGTDSSDESGNGDSETLESAWALAISIKQHGTQPHPFLFPAVEQCSPRYVQDVKDAYQGLK